eukprot:2439267-Pleurochrysis_carterae.AAC.1
MEDFCQPLVRDVMVRPPPPLRLTSTLSRTHARMHARTHARVRTRAHKLTDESEAFSELKKEWSRIHACGPRIS